MNRSHTTSRSFSTDQLYAALGNVGGRARPDYLPGIVARAGRIQQRPAWTFLGGWLSVDPAGRRKASRARPSCSLRCSCWLRSSPPASSTSAHNRNDRFACPRRRATGSAL